MKPAGVAAWCIRAGAWLVPAVARQEWRREWESELTWCADNGRGAAVQLRRASGALWHAVWLRGRQIRRGMVMNDFRYTVRGLMRARGFTFTAVSTLGFGLALCVAVLTAVNTYIVRGLPYPESGRLYDITGMYVPPRFDLPREPEKLDWSSLNDIAEVLMGWDLDMFNLRGGPYPEAAQGTWVTPGYMEGFGIRPAIGRAFEPQDFQPGRPPVAIISHRMWQKRFAGDPAVIGRTFESYSNDRPDDVGLFTIVGVLPENFWHIQAFTEVISPLRGPSVPYKVRLRPGVDPAVAAARISALVRSANDMPKGWQVELPSSNAAYVKAVRPLLLSLAAAAGLVLLIAAANVAVLQLIRATERQREMAVRKALGATAGQIARGIVLEAGLLAVAAVLLGVALAQMIVTALAPVVDRQLGQAAPGGAAAFSIDGLAWLGLVVGGVVIMFVCSVAPLWASRRTAAAVALTAGQKGASAGLNQQRARSALIVVEVAACLTLLVGAALMAQSAFRILATDIGLDARGVAVGRLGLRLGSYPNAASRTSFLERVETAGAAVPGFRGIGFANVWPLQESQARDISIDSVSAQPVPAGFAGVNGGYFDVLRIPIIDGRVFNADDRLGVDGDRVAIVSQSLARRLWPDQRPVGQRIRVSPPAGAPPNATAEMYQVIGVAGDTRASHTDRDTADVYVALSQRGSLSAFVYVRTDASPDAIDADLRTVLARIDGSVALGSTRPLADILDAQRASQRFLAELLMVFSGVAMLLALVGIYGVIAYAIRQRRREIAVRLAVGADRAAITSLFLRQGAVMIAAGLAIGLGGAIALGRVLEAQLFEVKASDPAVITFVTAAFACCGLLAVLLPARKAAGTDPADALKD